MLFWVLPAFAHFPHDVAAWVAMPPDRAWVLTSIWRTEAWMVARTENLQDMDVRFLAQGAEEMRAAVAVSEDRVLFGGITFGVWVSDDRGDTAVANPNLTDDVYDLELVGTSVYAAAESGLWVSHDSGDTWTQLLTGAFADVDGGTDGRACALGFTGELFCAEANSEDFVRLGQLPGEPWMVAVADDAVYVAAGTAGLLRSDGSLVPVDGMSKGIAVTMVAAYDEDLYVAAMNEGLFVREGGVWARVDTGLDVPKDGEDGAPIDGNHYFEVRKDEDGRLWFATWEGLYWTDDRLGWTAVMADSQTTHRSAAWSTTEDGVGKLIIATYGSGVLLQEGDNSDGVALSKDVDLYYPRNAVVSPHWSDEATLMFAHTQAYITTDAGTTWDRMIPMDNVQRMALPEGGPMIVTGANFSVLAIATSDNGVDWTAGTLPVCTGEASALSLSPDFATDRTFYVGCSVDGMVFKSTDAGLTAELIGTAAKHVWSIADTGSTVLAGTNDGLWTWNGSTFEQTAFAGELVYALARSPDPAADPAIYATILGKGVWRSEDGGQTFDPLPQPTDQFIVSVNVSPDFANDHVVTCSGYGGTYVSRDRGETWTWANLVEHHEPGSPYWHFGTGWTVSPQMATSTGFATATLEFRGVGVDLSGHVDGDGIVTASLDGGEAVQLSGEGILAHYMELPDTWHTLELLVDGPTLYVDDADVWRQNGPDHSGGDTGDTGDTGDSGTVDSGDSGGGKETGGGGDDRRCGCAASPAGISGVGVLLAGLVRRRRG